MQTIESVCNRVSSCMRSKKENGIKIIRQVCNVFNVHSLRIIDMSVHFLSWYNISSKSIGHRPRGAGDNNDNNRIVDIFVH